jgi:hypothetical protein
LLGQVEITPESDQQAIIKKFNLDQLDDLD